MGGFRGAAGGPDPLPQKNHKYRGVLCNTGPDPLKNHKATKPAFKLWPASARQWNAISMAFRWRVDDNPFIVIFGFSITSSTEKKNFIKFGPPLTKLSGSAHAYVQAYLYVHVSSSWVQYGTKYALIEMKRDSKIAHNSLLNISAQPFPVTRYVRCTERSYCLTSKKTIRGSAQSNVSNFLSSFGNWD